MAGVSLTLTNQDGPVQAALARLAALGGDQTPVMTEIGASLLASTQHRFETETGPDGKPWKPTYRGGAILRDSGRLYASLTYQAGRDQVVLGTNVIYAAVHQLGATIKSKTAKALRFKVGGRWASKTQVTVPSRPFLGLDRDDADEIRAIIGDHIDGLAAGVSA